MSIAVTNLTSGGDSTDQSTPYTTGSISPTEFSTLLVAWCSAHGTTAPDLAVSGFGLSWTTVDTQLFSGTTRNIGLAWAPVGEAPGSGTITLTPASAATGVLWIVDEETGGEQVNPIGIDPSYGANVFAATGTGVTSLTIPSVDNMRAARSALSRNYTLVGTTNATTGTIAPDSFGHTELAEVHGSSPGMGLATSWKSTGFDETVGPSFTGSTDAGGIAVELVAGALGDYQVDIVDAMLEIGARIEFAADREAVRWGQLGAALTGIMAAFARQQVILGYWTEAQFNEVMNAARGTDYPPIT